MSYNQKKVLKENIAAIRIALSNNPLSPEDIDIVKAYKGFGGLKCILFGDGTYQSWVDQGASKSDLELHEPMQELLNLLIEHFGEKKYKKILNSLKNSVLTAYYTPSVLPRTFYEVLKDYMQVRTIYEPSAGSGVFLQEAFNIFPEIEQVCAYEKDLLTAIVLERITESQYGHTIYNKPFEESSDKENGKYDLITSNIPFGEMKVYDPSINNDFCKKIHNYFFAKGIEKIHEGGVLAYFVSDAFLNTVSNKSIRQYLFANCDFISLVVMPDNLMKDTGNTEAPSHFLVVQKNSAKSCLSPEEELLVQSEFVGYGPVKIATNKWLSDGTQWVRNRIGIPVTGKNQYGKPHTETNWDKPINEIAEPFRKILQRDFSQRFLKEKTLVETFQELGEIMGATLQNITFDNSPLDKEELNFELAGAWEGESDIASTCVDCGAEKFGNDLLCPNCKEKENEPEHNLSDLLPEYVPFKDNIIVEYEKDN